MTAAAEHTAATAVRDALARFAPDWVDTPILQPAGLYLELVGEDIRARAFTLTGADGAEWCLRPDMTAPIVRDALANTPAGPRTVAYDGLVFRRQTRASARETEFRVVGAEVLTPTAVRPEDEADLIAATIAAARACGVEPHLRLGDIAVARSVVAAAGLEPAWQARIQRAFARTGGADAALGEAESVSTAAGEPEAIGAALADLAPERAAAVVEALLARSGAALIGGRSAADIARRLADRAALARAVRPTPAQIAAIREGLAIAGEPFVAFAALARRSPAVGAALDHARARWEALTAKVDRPVSAVFSAGFGRGPAYYDGMVFELEAPALGERASLGGGGRYDGLVRHLAAHSGHPREDLCAMGFSLRPRRLADAGTGGGR